ncbi:glycosyltransferase [Candidatus Dojkabacteria bacterium]|nr:glycosyltransferase [Candidatus Dojkabacteria bacterium]
MRKRENPRVAIVSDALLTSGGAEKVVHQLIKLYPDATLYTSIADPKFIKENFPKNRVIKSFIQYLPFEKYLRKELYLLYPWAYRLFPFLSFDIVISVSSGFAKYVRPWRRKTKHILYCLTPPKFFWMKEGRAHKDDSKFSYRFYAFFMDTVLEKIWQYWDRKAARKADYVISISNTVKERVKEYYGLDTEVIYPPVEVASIPFFKKSDERENWFLYVGRVERYKGVNLAIAACAQARVPLKILGTGTQIEDMKNLVTELNAKGLIKFLGPLPDEQKYEHLSKCKALIFPVKEEDFGIVAVEGNAAGVPVIALRSGGTMETISESNPKTGVFFNEWNALELAKIVEEFDIEQFDPYNCRKQAEQFSSELFRYKFDAYVKDVFLSKKSS